MNPTAIFSKTGKGVQEASGKTSNLSRADRAVLKEIDGKTTHASVAAKFEKIPADKFDALIQQFDKDGYIREVSSSTTAPQAPAARSAPPPPKTAPPPPSGGDEDEMDFTQAIKLPPKAAPAAPKPPPVDLAAASRAEAERKAKDQQAFDFRARQEAEAKAKVEADRKVRADAEQRARAAAEAKARAEAEEKARAAADAKARAESDGKALAEAEAKVKAAREAAVRMATEVKAKAEAEGKAKADELTGKLEAERKAREEAEKRAGEAAERARREVEEKAKRDAEELRQRLEAEMKAKLEEERKAREEEDRKRREEDDRRRAEEDRKRREEDERRRKEEEERRAKEEAERRAREEEDRKRREEDDRRRKEEDARRAKEEADREADRKRREEEDRKRREEEDRKRAEEEQRRKDDDARRAKEDADRRAKEDADRSAKEDADRRAKEDADRRAKDEAEKRAKEESDRRVREESERKAKEDGERKAREESEEKARAARAAAATSAATSSSIPSIPPVVAPPPPPPPPAAAAGDFGDSLLADLDSFGKREEEEQKAKEEEERKAKEAAARKAKEEAERKAKEEADRKRREAEERKRQEEEERRAKEEAEQKARDEEERQQQEEAERKRKAKEALAAKEAERKAAQQRAAAANPAKAAGKDDDIGVTDDDLDMDDVKKDEKALSATARKAAQERELLTASTAPVRRPKKWGKPAAVALFALLIGGVLVLQLMPVSTAEYEKAASEAMGVPVKIGSAHLSVITGIEARFDAVSIGDSVKIKTVRGYPEVGSLLGGGKKSFNRIELEGVSVSQSQLADAVLGKVSGDNLRIGRILAKQVKLDGPLTLPAFDVDASVAGDGSLQSVSLRGGDKLVVQLSPKGSDIGFEITAGTLALPFAPALNLSDFTMKGTANRNGVTASDFDGRNFDGVISGTAKIRWGATWTAEGEVRARAIRVAVLAPALVSEGRVDGRGAYTMSGPNPATLFEGARIQGEFKIDKGVLGSFDLTRALQTGGAQSSGRTVFSELTGQALYDKGTVKITNASITAGAMNAGASLDIDANGGLSGRVVADVKTPNQTLRATLNISGKIQDPVIRK